ncbi:hypothetical protein [Caenispirillum bisanense]|uniref:Uncharacterized protein n=1 Tax=Caenispirillum bisanense TaxID=414052 RepID=A0A286G9R8_9PROT|nr:hypothetical protein [Caenispirillum bisanense]SOD92293.1 hypothetical protein SAMN05421508_102361 [Caenispirillum bisanense]
MAYAAPRPKPNKRDVVLHERLQEAYDDGRLIVHTDFMRLNRTDSPVFSPWINVVPLLALLLLALILLFVAGLLVGTVALVFAVLVYVLAIRPWTANTVHKRALALMMSDAGSWMRLWAFGGIVLQLSANPRIGVAAPDGDWRAFASRYFAEKPSTDRGLSIA